MMGVMGPSGAGKTSLLAMIGGLLAPSRGRVELGGGADAAPARVHWIAQTSALLPHRTALDNVRLGPLSVGREPLEAGYRALASLERVGMGALASRRVRALSGGERQRVAVARILASGPGMILADEPTASLDPLSRAAVCEALRELRDAGSLVIVSTHDPAVAAACDRVLRIESFGLEEAPRGHGGAPG